MSSKRIYSIIVRQFFLIRHNWTRLSNIFIWILLDIILWGFITKYLDIVGNTEFSFIPVFLGAIVLWDFLIRVQQGVMLSFFEDVWSRNFMNFFSSPLKVGEYVLGLVVTTILTSLAALVAMLLLSLLFGFSLFELGLFLAPFLVILFLFGTTLGIFACGLVLRLGPTAEWLAWPIPFLIAPFTGVFYPISILPAPMEFVANLIPTSYVFEGMRGILFSEVFSVSDLVIGFILAIFFLGVAYLFFVKIYKTVLRNGLLTRFSAEYIP